MGRSHLVKWEGWKIVCRKGTPENQPLARYLRGVEETAAALNSVESKVLPLSAGKTPADRIATAQATNARTKAKRQRMCGREK